MAVVMFWKNVTGGKPHEICLWVVTGCSACCWLLNQYSSSTQRGPSCDLPSEDDYRYSVWLCSAPRDRHRKLESRPAPETSGFLGDPYSAQNGGSSSSRGSRTSPNQADSATAYQQQGGSGENKVATRGAAPNTKRVQRPRSQSQKMGYSLPKRKTCG